MRNPVNTSYEKFDGLPQKVICDTRRRMGRTKRWEEDMQARFAKGTFARIASVLTEGEDRTDFVREAVKRELERREGGETQCP